MNTKDSIALLDEYEAAKRLDLKVSTLRRWRVKGSELPYIKIGGRVRYTHDDIDAYINARRIYSTSADVQKQAAGS